MCMEDVLIGRRSYIREIQILVGTASIPVIPESQKRIALMFCGATAGVVTYSTISPVLANQGLVLAANSGPFIFNVMQHGQIVWDGWFAIAAAANTKVTIWETILVEDEHG